MFISGLLDTFSPTILGSYQLTNFGIYKKRTAIIWLKGTNTVRARERVCAGPRHREKVFKKMTTSELPLLQALEREFRQLEELDPSVADGFKIVYDREVPFELRPAESTEQEVGALEGIKVKVLTAGEENAITTLRVELSSETDLFFHYTCVVNHLGFQQLREDQKLMCEFREFVVTLLKMFNRCIKEPQAFLAVLILGADGSANLEFIQNMEYKFVDLLVLPFRESPEDLIRQHITYRYNAVRQRLSLMTARLQDVSALVKLKSAPVGA